MSTRTLLIALALAWAYVTSPAAAQPPSPLEVRSIGRVDESGSWSFRTFVFLDDAVPDRGLEWRNITEGTFMMVELAPGPRLGAPRTFTLVDERGERRASGDRVVYLRGNVGSHTAIELDLDERAHDDAIFAYDGPPRGLVLRLPDRGDGSPSDEGAAWLRSHGMRFHEPNGFAHRAVLAGMDLVQLDAWLAGHERETSVLARGDRVVDRIDDASARATVLVDGRWYLLLQGAAGMRWWWQSVAQ